MSVEDWLSRKFLEWEREQGSRKTAVEFAEYLGVSQPSLSSWMSGRYAPKGKNLSRLAEKLGYDIYDALGLPRPTSNDLDENTEKLVRVMREYPPDVQAQAIEAFRELVSIISQSGVTGKSEIVRMMAEMLRKRVSDSTNADKLASQITGIPRQVFPVGVGFYVERTKEARHLFTKTSYRATEILDSKGLDEDSDEGQRLILDIFKKAGFIPMETPPMGDTPPYEKEIP